MTRLLALILLALLIGLAARRLLLRARRSPMGQLVEAIWRSGATVREDAGAVPRQAGGSTTPLVPCGGCGVHVPADRTVRPDGRPLCARCAGDSRG